MWIHYFGVNDSTQLKDDESIVSTWAPIVNGYPQDFPSINKY